MRLAGRLGSLVKTYTPLEEDSDAVIELLTICASPHRDVQLAAMDWPASLVPERRPYGVRGESAVFADMHRP